MGEQTTTVVPFAAGGPSALATSRYLPATARKKIAFRPFQTGLASRQKSAPLDGRYRKNAAEAWPQMGRFAMRVVVLGSVALTAALFATRPVPAASVFPWCYYGNEDIHCTEVSFEMCHFGTFGNGGYCFRNPKACPRK